MAGLGRDKPSREHSGTKRARERRQIGRPTIFRAKLWQRICERIADGESLRRICRDDDMPGKSTVMRWLGDKGNVALRTQMEDARELQADDFVDEQNELSSQLPERHPQHGGYDAAHVAHIRNRISTLQWMAEKLKPKKYGNKAPPQEDLEDRTPDPRFE